MTLLLTVCVIVVLISFESTAFQLPSRNLFSRRPTHPSTSPSLLIPRSRRTRAFLIYSTLGQNAIDPALLTPKMLDQLFEDILYSGDYESVYRRNPRVFLHPKFLNYLKDRMKSLNDEDEISVVSDVIEKIEKQVLLSDGLGQDSELLYERRLDKIVFANPSERRLVLEEMKDDLSFGFVSFLQSELKAAKDLDVKVVLAEILHNISEIKGGDYLEVKEKALLSTKGSNSGNQVNDSADQLEKLAKLGDRNEQILAGLMFSKNDLVEDIFNNIQFLDTEFQQFLSQKIANAKELDEREALSSLLSSIKQVSGKIQELEAERLLDKVDDEELSFDAVKERMKAVQSGATLNDSPSSAASAKRKAEPFAVKATKSETFWTIVQRFEDSVAESAGNLTLIDVVRENYGLCDYEFLRTLQDEAVVAKNDGNNDLSRRLLDIKRAIDEVMVQELQGAQEKLALIFSKGDPKAMESEVVRMARRGEVNEALVLLIEANIQSAKQENAQGVIQLLTKLLQRIREEKERNLPEEQKLLRQLLKIQAPEKRKELLYSAFKPAKRLNEQTGEFVTNGPPVIPPPVFIDVVRNFITDFGNVDSFKIMELATQIIDEAQEVATELYGPGMTPQEQQRLMFEKNTVSVWDLASFEEQAMFAGEEVPWRNDKYDSKEVEDVLGERVKKIGGADGDI